MTLQKNIVTENTTNNSSTLKSVFTAIFFTDVHHSDKVFGARGEWSTLGLTKLERVLEESADCDFYVDFGDLSQYLPDGSTALYEEAYSFVSARTHGKRHYHLMGNHEAAFVEKSALSQFIPYKDGIGSAFVFEEGDVLFVAVDACFDRATALDGDLRRVTEFTIPKVQIDYLSSEVKARMHGGIKGIVWVSHVAFKDIDDAKWQLVGELSAYGMPLSVFEGHTHSESFHTLTNGDLRVDIYTMTSVNVDFVLGGDLSKQRAQYVYYIVKFKDGRVESVTPIRKYLPLSDK